MLAVIKTGGKQYVVSPGKKLKVEKINAKEGDVFLFEQVLLLEDGQKIEIGRPTVKGIKVEAKILKQGREGKIWVFKYHNKTGYRKSRGHRQNFTEVEIIKIS